MRRDRGRRLDANAIGWMEGRTWSGRMTRWGWLSMVLLWTSGWLGPYASDEMLWLGLVAGVGVASATSFQSDREQGSLELLLVTPLAPGAIIRGRLVGLVRQFAPAVLAALAFSLRSEFSGLSKVAAIEARSQELLVWAASLTLSGCFGVYLATGAASKGWRLAAGFAVPVGFLLAIAVLLPAFFIVPGPWDRTVYLLITGGMVGASWVLVRGAAYRLAQRRFLRR